MKLMRMIMTMLAAAAIASAAPACVQGTMADYLLLPEGCEIGDKVFSQWQYLGSAVGGATAIPASGVSILPITTALNPGFLFSAGWIAQPGQIVDSHITYTVTVPRTGFALHDLHLEITGYAFVNDGSVTVSETSNPVLSGTPLVVYASAALGVVPVDSSVFTPTFGSWVFTKDILVSGGQAGLGTLSGVINQFSEVPEPMTLSLIGAGLLAIGLLRRRKK